MRPTTYFFFYSYVLTLILAGAAGVLLSPLDLRLLSGLNPDTLPPDVATNLMSQMRFLRGIELGFGAFALYFRNEIFSDMRFCRIFLAGMGAGIAGRLMGMVSDGSPSGFIWFLWLFEVVGIGLILLYTHRTIPAAMAPGEGELR